MVFVSWVTYTFFFVGSLNFDAQLSTRIQRNSWENLVQTLILRELEVSDE